MTHVYWFSFVIPIHFGGVLMESDDRTDNWGNRVHKQKGKGRILTFHWAENGSSGIMMRHDGKTICVSYWSLSFVRWTLPQTIRYPTRYYIMTTTATRDVSGKIVKSIFAMKWLSQNWINLSLPCRPFLSISFIFGWHCLPFHLQIYNFRFQRIK